VVGTGIKTKKLSIITLFYNKKFTYGWELSGIPWILAPSLPLPRGSCCRLERKDYNVLLFG